MAEWLLDNDLAPDAIITSAANRALTTAQYVADHVGLGDADMDVRDELYLASGERWLRALHDYTGDHRLLICGHNPGLDDLVDFLAVVAPTLTTDGKLMTTAAVAHFDVARWSDLSAGSAPLLSLMRPKQLPEN